MVKRAGRKKDDDEEDVDGDAKRIKTEPEDKKETNRK
jgi:hypothetical protein